LEVLFSHPDAGPFREDPEFALCLLTEPAYEFDANYDLVPNSPLGREIPWDKSYQPSDVAPRVNQFISRVEIYRAHNLPWVEGAAEEQVDQEVLRSGIERDSDQWEGAWQEHWRNFWAYKNNLPWAIYRIWTTDPKWLQHMSTGLKYDSAAFCRNGPRVTEDRGLPEPT